jgi:hypothetical protein
MASVMSLGIVTQGVLLHYFGKPFLQGSFSKFLSILNLSLWLVIIISLIMAFAGGKFKELHYSSLINRFGIGTWVAGTSISVILLHIEFKQMIVISQFITFLDIILWLVYFAICLKTFREIFRTKSYRHIHGILLLSAVSTQSIVLAANAIFKSTPHFFSKGLVVLGFCFYFVSVLFILYRYFMHAWNVETDWNNTNCILHGALSISGIACLKTELFSSHVTSLIWFTALCIFIIVESIEGYRFIKRTKVYGLKNGILKYDVTQWSRIFTFAMFYTFTSLIEPPFHMLNLIKDTIIHTGIWLVLALLSIEILLSLQFIIRTYFQFPKVQKEQKVTTLL